MTPEQQQAEIARLTNKYREYEQNYILPCFVWAKEIGFNLEEAVRSNPGRNCVDLLVSYLREKLTNFYSITMEDWEVIHWGLGCLLDNAVTSEKEENEVKQVYPKIEKITGPLDENDIW